MRPSLLRSTSTSSKRWLARQFRDPYVQQRVTHPAHFRSRSAFKLLELDATFRFLLPRRRKASIHQQHSHPRVIVDLGAAPGGWSQVVALKYGLAPNAARKTQDEEPEDMQFYGLSQQAKLARQGAWSDRAHNNFERAPALNIDIDTNDTSSPPPIIIALDLQRIAPIPGVHTLQADFLSPSTTQLIRSLLSRAAPSNPDSHSPPPDISPIDLILSDMAPNATGHAAADAEHSLTLCDAVARFSETHLAVGGALVLKHFTHPTADYFRRTILKPAFTRVYNAKPPASRAASAEGYWVCVGYRGGPDVREQQQQQQEKVGKVQDQVLPEIPTDSFQVSLPAIRKQRQKRDSV